MTTPDPSLRHDMANLLTPAIIRAELLAEHPDPEIRQNALLILELLEKIAILNKTHS